MDAKAAEPLPAYSMGAPCPGRWFSPTPAWLVYCAAAATGVLLASERWRWFYFNQHKGWTILLAMGVVGAVLVVLLAWMLVALMFRRRVLFGVSTLLVSVTVCAVVCSWLAAGLWQARRQAEAVAALSKKSLRSGGLVLAT